MKFQQTKIPFEMLQTFYSNFTSLASDVLGVQLGSVLGMVILQVQLPDGNGGVGMMAVLTILVGFAKWFVDRLMKQKEKTQEAEILKELIKHLDDDQIEEILKDSALNKAKNFLTKFKKQSDD